MKITLINPPITSRERYGRDFGDIGGHQAPLGICCLAAFLEKYGFEVNLIDAEAEKIQNCRIIKKIGDLKSDVVGITSTTVAFKRAQNLAAEIKLFNPEIPVIIGGPHLTANPHETLSFECFDYGVMNEGEITLLELLKALEENSPAQDIQGIVYRKNGDVIINPLRPYISNLDSLPFPARHLLPDIRNYVPPLGSYSKTPVASIITSRGCPSGCIFCDNNVFGRNIRYHSPEYIVSEIKNVIDIYGAKEIFFLDDTFVVDKERIRKFLFLIRKEKIKIKWSCMTRVNNMSRDLLQEMKDAGCWQISIGIESGNQKILNFIKKGINLGQVRDTVKWSNEIGIFVKGFFMIGHPIDTIETIDETIKFAKSIPLTDVVVTIATPIPGTKLHSIARDYGTLRTDDSSDFSCWKSVFVPHGLTEKILYDKQRQFYKKFYIRINIILRQVMKIRSIRQIVKYIIYIKRCTLLLKMWENKYMLK